MSRKPSRAKYSASARVETVIPPACPAVASRATSALLAVFMCGRSTTPCRPTALAMISIFLASFALSSSRQGVAFADETHRAPGARAPDGGETARRRARGVERQVGAAAVGQVFDRRNGVARARIHHSVCAELPRAGKPLGAHVERDHPRAHRR